MPWIFGIFDVLQIGKQMLGTARVGRCDDSVRESGATTFHIILLIGWQILVVKLSV